MFAAGHTRVLQVQFFASPLYLFSGCQDPEPEPALVNSVNPLIGTDSEYAFSHGNTYPAVALPFGMTSWTPQTGKRFSSWIYQHDVNSIVGFRATHQASVWRGDYGQFSLMPVTGDLVLDVEDRRTTFSRENEFAAPHVYRTHLDKYGIDVEMSPTLRCAIFRMTPAQPGSLWVVFDTDGGGDFFIDSEQQRATGVSERHSGGVGDHFGCHFVADFRSSMGSVGAWNERGVPDSLTVRGGFARFFASPDEPLVIAIGTSFIGADQAAVNLEREIGDRTFDEVEALAAATWEKALQRIRITGATAQQRTTFYTALYRSLLFPRIWHEEGADGTTRHYSPYDGEIHEGLLFADQGLWDTFRTAYPLWTLIWPERVAQIIKGWTNAYLEGGWFPNWSSPGYRQGMAGTHMEAVVADAYLKGVTDFDTAVVFEGLLRNGNIPGTDRVGRLGLEAYLELGYVPSDKVKGATSRTLEFAYGDFCIATMAKALGRDREAADFSQRAANWRNVFDTERNYVRGRRADGEWEETDLFKWGGPFIEGTAWQHTYAVLHDLPALVQTLGGPQRFGIVLDRFFDAPPTFYPGDYEWVRHEMVEMTAANMGQYAHNNQTSHHIPYLYNYSDRPWKTQHHVRRVLDELYGAGPKGLLGDEDTGPLSSWYIFSTLGFYPICPGKPEYTLGGPRFESVTIDLPQGRRLKIIGQNNGDDKAYVQEVSFNGRRLARPFLSHADLVQGGELLFVMGGQPKKDLYDMAPRDH